MPHARSHLGARIAALLSVALAFTGLQLVLAPEAQANPGGTALVINEVYLNGGSAGATYTNKFVELYNPTGSAITFTGSLQYRSYNGTGNASASGKTDLTAITVPANGHWLISGNSNGAIGQALPTPNTPGSIAFSGNSNGGTIWLTTSTALANPSSDAGLVDKIGYGLSNSPEGSAEASGYSVTSSLTRTAGADTDVNSADFSSLSPPTPTNAAGETGPPPASTPTINTISAKSGLVGSPITSFTASATGGTTPYAWSDNGTLPPGVSINATSGQVSGTPTTSGTYNVVITVTDNAVPQGSDTEPFTFTVGEAPTTPTPISTLQGTGARSTYAPATGNGVGPDTVIAEGVVTAVYTRGFATSGAANCGFCGFTIQTGGSGGAVDATPGAADGIFVYGGTSFAGKDSTNADLAIGDSVRVSGKVSEFSATGDTTGSLTELNVAGAADIVPIADLPAITKQTVLPATYAEREAHESELFAPTDVVITDTFNFETFGELGLATGNEPLVQPTEICADDDTTCINTAQADIKNRGYFTEDGTSTSYLTSSSYYRPYTSNNSDIPLPFMDKTHSARIGAQVTYPQGGVLEYRNRKWYVQVPRPVLSTHNGVPDLGEDVLTIQDTRPDNLAPADVQGDLVIATYNVENFFSITGEAFAAANPFYTCSSDFDRLQQPVAVNECTSTQAIPTAWDPVTNAPTAYGSGLVSAPRGAWRQADLDRQTAKIVTAINGLGADVVTLEELGNPNKLRMGVTNGPLDPDANKADSGFGTPIAWRDESIAYLVDALNDDAGAGTWGFVASPEESTDATAVAQMCSTVQPNGAPVPGPAATAGTCSWASGQDVIRSGFIYKMATVVPVGPSDLDLPNSSAPVPSPFDNAREPLAQFFKPIGHPNSDGFAVIANHFKSKGDSDPDATGGNANSPLVGAFNQSRTEQAEELLEFANEFAAKWDTDKVFLVGDFNSYSGEDPIQAILDDPANTLGFDLLESDDPTDTTYIFSHTFEGVGYGAKGSLDHVFASAGAQSAITGVDVWEINANESSAFNFGRFNTNKTGFLDAATPFAGSDHNPEIIGLDVAGTPSVRDIQLIGTNDFHGRLLGSSSDGGAAQLAGAVKSLKDTWGVNNSAFVAAGDLIGASTFESFVQQDKPTLEALNAAGLEISAVGNHEFDQGVDDLLNRVMKPYDPDTNPYGAEGGLNWDYIGANVLWETDPDGAGPVEVGDPIVLPTQVKDFGGGITFGFVGAVTEDLMSLVNPAGMEGVEVTPIAAAVNQYATQLKADGADVVVLLVHEGAPSTSCATMDDSGTAFGDLLGDINPDIDAVISGHTHLEYSCTFPVPEWAADPITERPVVSAGQYGVALDQLVWSFDTATGDPVDVVSNNVGVKGPGSTLFSYPEDPAVKAIVDAAVADSVGPGSVVLGRIAGPFRRARLANGVTENRGGESTLGNLVAEIQRWATPTTPEIQPAQIAFMNPGGLRDDMNGSGASFPKDVTYKAAAGVQPFANTLVNIDMTGAQIEQVLEQQWQRDAQGNVPSRPFLRLGTSDGFTYTYTESSDLAHPGAKLGEVTSMWLNGVQIADGTTYSVTMNSFLASGGDNFRAFLLGTDKRDTGVTDLQAQVDYMAANAEPTPLAVDYGQHAVRVTFPVGAPAAYAPGDTVEFDLASLAMTGVDDLEDATIEVVLDGEELGSFPVDNAASNQPVDEAGTASVSVELPTDYLDGTARLHLVGATTGTDVIVPIAVDDGLPDTTVSADDQTATYGQDASVEITVDPAAADGSVSVLDGDTVLGTATLAGGAATVTIPAAQLPAVGAHELTLTYSGEAGAYSASSSGFTLTVGKATATATAGDAAVTFGQDVTVPVTVTGPGGTPTGMVEIYEGATKLGEAALSAGAASVLVDSSGLSAGTHDLIARYVGNANYLTDDDPFVLTVNKAAATVTADDVTIPYGQQAPIQVSVTGGSGPAGGTVEIFDGARSLGSAGLVGGAATITLAPRTVPAGTRTLRAVYSGGGGYSPGETELQLTVLKATPTLSVDAPTVRFGKASTVTVVVAAGGAAPGGTVELRQGATLIASGTVSGGTATIELPKRVLSPGNIALTAAYSGDANTLAGNAQFVLTVLKAKSKVDIEVKPGNIRAKRTEARIVVKVEADGISYVSGKVRITVQGLGTTTLTLLGGQAVLELSAFKTPGKRNVTVKYLGNDLALDDTAKDVINVKP